MVLGRICQRICRFFCMACWTCVLVTCSSAVLLVFLGPIILILLFLTRLVYDRGVSFLVSLEDVFQLILTTLEAIASILNMIHLLLPDFFTLVNLILEIIVTFLGDLSRFFCNPLPFTSGFNAVTDCPVVFDLLSLAPILFDIVYNLILILVFVFQSLGSILEIYLCMDRDGTSPPLTGLEFPFIDPDCARMCAAIGDTPGCFNFITGLTFLLTGGGLHLFFFLVNVVDLTFINFLYWSAFFIGKTSGVLTPIGLSSFSGDLGSFTLMYDFVIFPFQTEGRVLAKLIVGSMINYLIIIPDYVWCNIISPYIIECIGDHLCRTILWFELCAGSLCLHIANFCPWFGRTGCPCKTCPNGLSALLPALGNFFYSPAAAGCPITGPTKIYSFTWRIIEFWEGISLHTI